jgi:uncharacterized protein (DUF58 family)
MGLPRGDDRRDDARRIELRQQLGIGVRIPDGEHRAVGMHHCHRNLLGLEVDATREADGFAGERATLQFVLRNASGIDRWDVEIRCPDFAAPGAADAATTSSATASVTAMSQQQLSVALATPRRGILQLSQFELRTRYPFGWFRAWSYVHAPLTVYVAPQPQGERPLTSGGGAAGTAANTDLPGDEDFAGLRAYAPGIPLKHMAWKVLARGPRRPCAATAASRPNRTGSIGTHSPI